MWRLDRGFRRVAAALLGLLAFAIPMAASGICVTPPGDVDDDGLQTITDVQCAIIVTLYEVAGSVGPLPGCLGEPAARADLNCDAEVNASDVILVTTIVLENPLAPEVDSDGNLCADVCEFDFDDDGSVGLDDCAPFDPDVFPGAPEICDGKDNDCNPLTPADTVESCDDSNACTVDLCAPGGVCLYAPVDCDDANPSTVDYCAPPGGCLNVEGAVICEVSGTAGEEFECDLDMARSALGQPEPTALQFALKFNSPRISILQFEDDVELIPGFVVPDQPTPPSLLSSGHSVALFPDVATGYDAWNAAGQGTAVIVDLAGGVAPISQAFATPDGAISGEPQFAQARFLLAEDIPAETPELVVIDGIVVADADAQQLEPTVIDETIIVELGNCSEFPEVCDDGNACTADVCLSTGACSNTDITASCDDGDICTGEESCDPAVGCVAGTPLECPDGGPCTATSCSPELGCQVDLVDCDDGDPATVDSCDPAVGCINVLGGEFCFVSGSIGDIVECDVRVARSGLGQPLPAALQYTVTYPNELVTVVQLEADLEPIPGLVVPDQPTPPNGLATGHSVSVEPPLVDGEYTNWNAFGIGKVLLADLSGAGAALSEAFIQAGGDTDGDSLVMQVRVELRVDADEANPIALSLSNLVASTADAQAMTAELIDQTIVVSLEDCAGLAGSCADGDPCTADICQADGTCSNPVTDGLTCDDGDTCTENDACSAGVCVGQAVDCDDANPCTDDLCDPTAGCQSTEVSCDDSDPNTIDFCDPTAGCVNLLGGAICELSGAAGEEVLCELQLARSVFGEPAAASLQLTWTYDSADLALGQFEDDITVGPGIPVPNAPTPPNAVSSGHTVALEPPADGGDYSTWDAFGGGKMLLANIDQPETPLTAAFRATDGSIDGSSQVVRARFTLLQEVAVETPTLVFVGGLLAATPDANALEVTIEDAVLLTSLADCTTAAGACDDGDICTVDACEATGSCSYALSNLCLPGCGDGTCDGTSGENECTCFEDCGAGATVGQCATAGCGSVAVDCFCDDACAVLGDCCDDKGTTCGCPE